MGSTGCVVVGGGPAGMVLGLLLARAGVAVTVLEKHGDFLRDFRGDTVHSSTLTLLDELGLGEEFAALPQARVRQVAVELDNGSAVISLDRLPGPHPHVAMVPQWDFLELLATAARREPTFTLIRNAEVTGLVRDGTRVVGVRFRERTPDHPGLPDGGGFVGPERELRAPLTVACDGRGSTVRRAAGLRPRSFGVPVDVWWFRLPREPGDRSGAVGRISVGRMMVMLDRGSYWQCAYLIRKGGDAAMRAAGLGSLRADVAELVPWLGDRTGSLTSWDDVKLLDVRVDRLRRWSLDGLLLIGDAAHAMSPVGGVGINLAVADAVATARLLAGPLRAGTVPRSALRRVRRRRWMPTAVVQTGQRIVHRVVFGRQLTPRAGRGAGRVPGVGLLRRFPALQVVPAYLVAIGPLPEHAPEWARRAPRPPEARPQAPGPTERPTAGPV